eukprot:COSAG01_NODE_35761_length_527_cov_0.577103_1_plen_146_part_10
MPAHFLPLLHPNGPAWWPGTEYILNDVKNLNVEWLRGGFDGGTKRNGAIVNDGGDSLAICTWGAWLENDQHGVVWQGGGPAGQDPTRGTNNTGEAIALLAIHAAAAHIGGKHVAIRGDARIVIDKYNHADQEFDNPEHQLAVHMSR